MAFSHCDAFLEKPTAWGYQQKPKATYTTTKCVANKQVGHEKWHTARILRRVCGGIAHQYTQASYAADQFEGSRGRVNLQAKKVK